MIHVYCGDGKGKTTAAMGLIARALGRGRKVVLVQFLKSWETGEILFLEKQDNITILRSKDTMKFTFNMDDNEKLTAKQGHDKMLEQALQIDCDLLVLDEVMSAYNTKLLDESIVKSAVENWDKEKELVLTGRSPEEFFVSHADYVTEMKCVKHPYTQGTLAREGVEF